MYALHVRNVQGAFRRVLDLVLQGGAREESRNGPVLRLCEPLSLEYERPWERVLFTPERDANPFFHLAEALWMLGGRSDVAFVKRYVARMADYSDDGVGFHGAYGMRWRDHFVKNLYGEDAADPLDQLWCIVQELREDPGTRRLVLSMWDPEWDLCVKSKDLPCNTHAYFQRAVDGKLDMMVCNRSNDVVWGMLGANAVHFSVLHEYVARSSGLPQGRYHHVTFNAHAYLGEVLDKVRVTEGLVDPYQKLEEEKLRTVPLMSVSPAEWGADLLTYLGPRHGDLTCFFSDPFFQHVAHPMAVAYRRHKELNRPEALGWADSIRSPDWRLACVQWLERRYR